MTTSRQRPEPPLAVPKAELSAHRARLRTTRGPPARSGYSGGG
jgi:hypothetical protein